MNKVWVIEVEKGLYGEYVSEIFKIRNTPGKAQLVKMHILANIAKAKNEYKEMYGSSYDEDWELVSDDELLMNDEERYDKLVEQLYTHKMRNGDLKITNINITEHDVE